MTSLDSLQALPDESFHDSWEDVRTAVQNWSVLGKFTFKTSRKDVHRAQYDCARPGCSFRVAAYRKTNGQIHTRVLERQHTCDRSSDDGKRGAPPLTWLLDVTPKILAIGPATKPQDVIDAINEHYSESVEYQSARRCLHKLQAESREVRHRPTIPDSLRKAVITLKVFQNLDWADIEKKTGVKASTASYIYKQALKKSGGVVDPVKLLENSGPRPGGPAPGNDLKKSLVRRERGVLAKQRASLEFARRNLVAMHAAGPEGGQMNGSDGGDVGENGEEEMEGLERTNRADLAMQLARAANEMEDEESTRSEVHSPADESEAFRTPAEASGSPPPREVSKAAESAMPKVKASAQPAV